MATLRVRRVDSARDMTFGKGRSNYAATAEATAQRLQCEIQLILGEWFLDTSAGVPWWQPSDSDVPPIMGAPGPRNLSYAEGVLKAKILSVDGVDSIQAFAMSFVSSTRKLSVSCTLTTVDGDTFNIKVINP